MPLARIPSIEVVVEALSTANFLSEEQIRFRSALLYQDLTRWQIEEFRILPVRIYPASVNRPEIRVIEYEFGPVSFSLDNAHDPSCVRRSVQEMTGTAIDREDILYLSQVSKIGHSQIPLFWRNNPKLNEDIRLPTKHLDTLNEVWWLKCWHGLRPTTLKRDIRISSDSRKAVDWQFKVSFNGAPWTINLEVKRIISSIGYRAYARQHFFYATYRGDGRLNIDDPRLKFRASGSHEVNVLAITWFDEISAELESEIRRFMDEDSRIDVVALWAPGDRRRGGWTRYFSRFRDISEKRGLISSALIEPDDEDRARIIAFMFPRTLQSIQDEMRDI